MDEREREDVSPGRGRPTNESLRGLAAPGPSKVGSRVAMRARDVSRSGVTPREGGPRENRIESRPESRPESRQGHRVGWLGSSGSSPVDS